MPAVKNTPANGTTPVVGATTGRAMPVAVEISVTATGAKPSGGMGQRELFTEVTSTVLVLPDGAVIRLAAAVTQRQLIFLTNNTTKREVVCQVLRKRSYRPTSCYVELQFTEAAADFWGVDFLTEEVVSAGAKESGVVEEVAAAEAIVEDPPAAVSAPNDKEVLQLRGEVEALRAQLQSLIVKKEESAPVAPAPSVAKIDVAEAMQISRSLAANSASNAQAGEAKAGGEDRPESHHDSQEDAMEHLLPEVGLDFSKVPANVRDEGLAGPNGKPPLVDGRKFVRIGGLVAVLALVVFGAWFNNWLPFLKRSVEPTASGPAGNVAQPVAKVSPAAAPATAASGTPSGGSAVSGDSKNSVVADTAKSPDAAESAKSNNTDENSSAERKDSVAKDAIGKNSRKRGEKVSAAPTEVLADNSADAAISPAKLVQAVNPVYPPDAMRNYITGDVRLDAVVEADGRVGAMSVVYGPAPLRAAAMEALKQYKYSPAMQNGKGVASHVRLTIKFWFDP